MKKQTVLSWFAAVLTFAAAVVGFCLRRVQLLRELLPDGSLAEGSSLWLCLLILVAAFAAVLIGLLLPMERLSRSRDFFSVSPLPNFAQLFAAAALLAGNVFLLFRGADTAFAVSALAKVLSFLLPFAGIAAAFCLGAFAIICSGGRSPSPTLYMVITVYLAIRLLLQFQRWNADPSLHDYAYSLLAAICCMLAAFRLGGFGFDKGKRRISLFWTLCTVVFCAITEADVLRSGEISNILINTALLASMTVSGGQLLFGKSAH